MILRPWEVESNIHHIQLGKKKTLKIQEAATKSLKTQRGGKLTDKIAGGFLPASMHFCLCVERQIKNSKPLDPLGVFKTSSPVMLQDTNNKEVRYTI